MGLGFNFTYFMGITFLTLLVTVWMALIPFLCLRRRWGWAALLFLIGAAEPSWLLVMHYHPFGPVGTLRILDHADMGNGTELVLAQSRNGNWREPYSATLWFKPKGKPWACTPLEFEEGWWRRGSLRVRGMEIAILNGGRECGRIRMKGGKPVDPEDEDRLDVYAMKAGWEPREGGEYEMEWQEPAPEKTAEGPRKKIVDR